MAKKVVKVSVTDRETDKVFLLTADEIQTSINIEEINLIFTAIHVSSHDNVIINIYNKTTAIEDRFTYYVIIQYQVQQIQECSAINYIVHKDFRHMHE